MAARPHIPEPTKRAVRQRCLFGCVVCGMPIFEYDHLEPYADVCDHDADNIILLCPNHHRDKTSGRLVGDRLQHAGKHPFNEGRPKTASFAIERGRVLDVVVGSNVLENPVFDANGHFPVLWVNGFYRLGLHQQDGWMTLSASVTDGAGEIILGIDHGELIAATGVWDYRYEGTRLQIRLAAGVISLDLDLTNELFHVHRGAFLDRRDGSGFVIQDGVLLTLAAGKVRSETMGGLYGGNRGGFGIANRLLCDPKARPIGFGGFVEI